MAYGLINPRPFPIMHCGCDESFRSCLKKEGSVKSKMVGQFYFDHLKSPCFVFKPGKSCAQRTWFGKCLEWSSKNVVGEWRKPKKFNIFWNTFILNFWRENSNSFCPSYRKNIFDAIIKPKLWCIKIGCEYGNFFFVRNWSVVWKLVNQSTLNSVFSQNQLQHRW